jgi:flagellar hook-length control protein FliK
VQQARLQLHPQELGPVLVRIQLEGQAAQVHLAAEQAFTRQALEQALPALAGQLSDAGFTLAGGGVFEKPPGAGHQRQAEPRPSAAAWASGEDGAGAPETPLAGAAAPRGWRARGIVDLVA